jgi:hypothetical protein
VVAPAEGDPVALPNRDDAISSESEDDRRLEAATETELDADNDTSALLLDGRNVLENNDDELIIVELRAGFRAAEIDTGVALLPSTLVGAGEGVTGPVLA